MLQLRRGIRLAIQVVVACVMITGFSLAILLYCLSRGAFSLYLVEWQLTSPFLCPRITKMTGSCTRHAFRTFFHCYTYSVLAQQINSLGHHPNFKYDQYSLYDPWYAGISIKCKVSQKLIKRHHHPPLFIFIYATLLHHRQILSPEFGILGRARRISLQPLMRHYARHVCTLEYGDLARKLGVRNYTQHIGAGSHILKSDRDPLYFVRA